MRKGKDPEPDPYLWLMDPGGPKTCGSGSPTLPIGTRRRNIKQKIKWTGQLTLVLFVALKVVVVLLFHVSSEVGGLRELVAAHSALKWARQCGLFYSHLLQILKRQHLLDISDILVWIRILGSVPLTNGSGSCSIWILLFSSATFKTPLSFFASYFLKVHLHHFLQIKALKKHHKKVEITGFLNIFSWWSKAPDPDPYLWLMDSDPGGPKTYCWGGKFNHCYGSGNRKWK